MNSKCLQLGTDMGMFCDRMASYWSEIEVWMDFEADDNW